MWAYKFRMYLLMATLFGIIYAVVSVAGYALGIVNFYFYLFLALAIASVQYMIGPKIVEWSMHVRYLKEGENPRIQSMVRDLAAKAGLSMPRVGVSQVAIPNAFAFGRSRKDARICVTEGIMGLLNDDEMRAVLGHEMSHIKNRDVLTITVLSVVPIILYRIAFQFLFFGGRRGRNSSNGFVIGLVAFLFYFLTNLLVLYASRIREYFADKGSIDLGNHASNLASALYKLVYGSARMPKEAIKEAEGMKAFFVNDPSKALSDLKDLRDLDLDKNGIISDEELNSFSGRTVKLKFSDVFMELLSTHPNMLKRVKRLSELGAGAS